jgi:hypothetical protein
MDFALLIISILSYHKLTMGRKGNQKKCKNARKIQNSSIEDLLVTSSPYECFIQNRYSPDSLKSLRKELKDAITKIYTKYFLHFCKLKDYRAGSQNPLIPISTEELIIEKNYCNELTQKVKQLVHLDSLNDIYFTFCKSVNSFVSQIYCKLQELKDSDPCLQLACLAEAYFVVENSCRELSKVTSGIFDQKLSYVTCENVTKLAFLDQVVKHFSETTKQFQGTEDSELLQRILSMEQELYTLNDRIRNLDKQTRSQSTNFLSPLPHYCVDEIVNYINGDFKEIKKKVQKIRRVSKASTAETSGSPYDRKSRDEIMRSLEDNCSSALDKEIEEFQCILDSTQPLRHKLKPKFTEEWLKKIRSLILKKN